MSASEPQDADLPKAMLKRLIKAKLQDADRQRGGDGSRDYQVNKDALLAFGEAGKLFVHYLTAAANDVCKEAKRLTISADDVLTALADLEFDEFIEPLKAVLEGFKSEMREKNVKKKAGSKKRKSDAASPPGGDAKEEEPAAAPAAEEEEGGGGAEEMEAGE